MTLFTKEKFSLQDTLGRLINSSNPFGEKAWKGFEKNGFPHPDEEIFRFLKLKELYQGSYESGFSNNLKIENQTELPPQIIVKPFFEALQSFGSYLRGCMQRELVEEKDPFALLNLSCFRDGLFIYVPQGIQCNVPLTLVHHVEKSVPGIFFPRIYLYLGKEASLTLCMKETGDKSAHWINSVLDVTLDEKAHIECISLSSENTSVWNFKAIRVKLKEASTWKSVSISDGAKAYREDYRIVLAGKESNAHLYGTALLKESNQATINVFMEHLEPSCISLQRFKNLLADRSRAHFEGKIYVHAKAQKTQAYQKNNNLLLSDGCLAKSKPNLEIFADDVKASHGATMGKLNEEELFYLKTRGLSETMAKRLLIQGFLREILSEISVEKMRLEAESICNEPL